MSAKLNNAFGSMFRLRSGRQNWRMKSLALLMLLGFLPQLFAQTSAISAAVAPMALYINIVEGEDALNNIHDRTAREPIVQITDENHKPVKGAYVTFSDVAGATGAAATFGGLLTYTAVTDANGRAVGRGFQPNQIVGDHRVQVTAVLGMLVAALIIIHEKNVSQIVPPVEVGPATGAGAGAAVWAFSSIGAAVAGISAYLGLHSEGPGLPTPNAATSTATPVSAPEIDPSLALGSLALLAGAVAVLRRR